MLNIKELQETAKNAPKCKFHTVKERVEILIEAKARCGGYYEKFVIPDEVNYIKENIQDFKNNGFSVNITNYHGLEEAIISWE